MEHHGASSSPGKHCRYSQPKHKVDSSEQTTFLQCSTVQFWYSCVYYRVSSGERSWALWPACSTHWRPDSFTASMNLFRNVIFRGIREAASCITQPCVSTLTSCPSSVHLCVGSIHCILEHPQKTFWSGDALIQSSSQFCLCYSKPYSCMRLCFIIEGWKFQMLCHVAISQGSTECHYPDQMLSLFTVARDPPFAMTTEMKNGFLSIFTIPSNHQFLMLLQYHACSG